MAQYCILKHSGFQPAKLIVAEGSTDKKCQQNYGTMYSDKSGFFFTLIIVENNYYFLFILYILNGMSGDNLILQNFNQATTTLFTFI